MSKIADVTQSFRKYLDTQKDYFDYLRNRPRFFLSTHYIDKRLVIVKTSVEEAKKEEEDGSRRRRRKPKQPTKVPVKQPVKQVEQPETVKEPVSTPVKVPPIIKPPVLSLPGQKPAETPVAVPSVPIKTPKPIETPVFNLDKLLSKAPGTHTPAEAQFLIDNGYDNFVKGGMSTTDPVGDVITLVAAAVISFFALPALVGGGATATGTTGGVAATSKIVGTGGTLSRSAPALNKIVPLVRQAAPVAFSYGGAANSATFSLAGERVPEVAVPHSKLGEFAKAVFREAGSIATGIAMSVAKQIPAGSATTSLVSKLASVFGVSKGFSPEISIPSQIPSFDVADTKVDEKGTNNLIQRAISFGKNVAKSIVPLAVAAAGGVLSAGPAAAHHEQPLAAAPIMVPEYDPSMQGAQITPAGSTDTDNISGYPITSRYGPRWGRLHGGIDVGVPEGTAIGLNVPGEIVFAGTAGGYGYVIDAWVPSLGAQFRLAHLSKFFKKSGTFTAGEALGETGGAKGHPGAGSSTGPHLHYEIDTTKGGSGYGGARNPELLSKLSKHIMMGSMSQGSSEQETEGQGGQQFVYENNQKTSQTDIVRQERTQKLEISRVNSIVEIPIQGPPSYTPQLTTIMREKSSKRPYIISPFSKGVEQ